VETQYISAPDEVNQFQRGITRIHRTIFPLESGPEVIQQFVSPFLRSKNRCLAGIKNPGSGKKKKVVILRVSGLSWVCGGENR
jgi:hypothetical protein